MEVMSSTMISEEWAGRCVARANRRAAKFLVLAVLAALVMVLLALWSGSKWPYVLIPVCIELAAPGLRYFVTRPKLRGLMRSVPWKITSVRFVPGRSRIGRQAHLEMAGSDRSYLRLPEMPESVREHVRRTGQLWLAGPDDRGRAAVMTEERPFVILARVVIR
jgi:hypothetical protein